MLLFTRKHIVGTEHRNMTLRVESVRLSDKPQGHAAMPSLAASAALASGGNCDASRLPASAASIRACISIPTDTNQDVRKAPTRRQI